MNVLEIPGYLQAVIRERVVRDAAFLGINETIAGFEVVPMTLRHYIILRVMGNPLIRENQTPAPEDVFNFLWLLSSKFTAKNSWAKRWFRFRCWIQFFPAINPKWLRRSYERRQKHQLTSAARIVDAIRAYVAET